MILRSFSQELWISNPYIFATQYRRPLIFKTMKSVRSNTSKCQRFTTSGCKDSKLRVCGKKWCPCQQILINVVLVATGCYWLLLIATVKFLALYSYAEPLELDTLNHNRFIWISNVDTWFLSKPYSALFCFYH